MKISSAKKSRMFAVLAAIFTILASMLSVQPAAAELLNSSNFLYSETAEHEIIIRGYLGTPPATLTIPSQIDSKPVVSIGELAFVGAGLNDLVISEGVRDIGLEAFKRAYINNIVFPSTLETLGASSFAVNTMLQNVTFKGAAPTCVASCIALGDETDIFAYQGAPGFSSTWQGRPVTFLDRLQYTVANNEATITGYVGTPASDYVIPETLGGAPVVAIADEAFKEKGLTSVKLPKTLKTIGARAFSLNSLSSLTIPASVTDIGFMAFSLNPTLASVTFNGNAPTSGGSLFAITSPQMTTLTIRPGATGFGSLYEMFPLVEVAPPSNVAILSLLAPSAGSFTPAFSPDVHNYSITVPYSTDFFGLTPNPESGFGTVTLNGEAIDGWQTSYVMPNVGDNTYTFICTAQDGETTETYTVVVTREAAPSNDSSLKNLVPSVGTLVPTGMYDYTVSVPSDQTSIAFTATVNEAHASLKIQGVTAQSGQAKNITLAVGSNTVDIEVTSQTGLNTTLYRVIVTRAAPIVISSDAKLASLAIDKGSLSTAFSSTTTAYSANVDYATSSVKVTPTVNEGHATVKVNGVSATSGIAQDVSLAVGSNTISVEVLAQDGSTKKTYTISVTRAAASTTATLSGLVIKNVTLSPTFSSGTSVYTSTVANSVTSYTVKATLSDSKAQLKINGVIATSAAETATLNLSTGANTITIEVTAQDGTTKKTYTVTVTRSAADSNANLSALSLDALTLSPKFATGTTSYTATAPYAIGSVSITATVAGANATLKVKGATASSGVATAKQNLAVGQNVIAVEVTAQDGTKKTYNLTITRTAPSTDATLVAFSPGIGAFAETFATSKLAYTQSVSNEVSKLQVRATSANDGAIIRVNGTVISSGDLSAPISLNVGDNTITAEVTAENGSTKKVYTVVVKRAAPVVKSSDAKLKSLLIGTDALSQTELASGATKNVKVDQTVTTTKFTPTVNESHATIKINGRSMASGRQSSGWNLAMGANTFNIVVTAENGTDTKTYTVVITRKVFSTNSKLKSLSTNLGSLDSAFSSSKTSYSKTVAYAISKATFTISADDSNASVMVEGQPLNSSASATVNLQSGLNVVDVVVTAESGAITTYKVSITRSAASTNSKLKSLTLSVGALDPAFSSSKLTYSVTVASSVASLVLTVIKDDALASIKVGDSSPDSQNAITLQPAVGDNTFLIQVTAESGAKTTYTLNVKRQNSGDKIVVGTISVEGLTSVGEDLKATIGSNGKGNPAPNKFTYTWQRCTRKVAGQGVVNFSCQAISGATSSTYRLTTSDVGNYIAVYVVATNGIDIGTALSASTLVAISK